MSTRSAGAGGSPGEGGIPPARAGGPAEPPARVQIQNAGAVQATVTPRVGGIAHVILEVEDNGTPALTSYRRIVLRIRPASKP